MKRFISIIILLLPFLALQAQNTRSLRGVVCDEAGMPVFGALVKADGNSLETTTDKMGQFNLDVPFSTRSLSVFKDGYPTTKVDIASNSILVRLLKTRPQTQPAHQTAVTPVREERAPADTASKAPAKKFKAGFAGSVDLSYLYGFNTGNVTFTNIGEQKYGALHPLELTVSLGYRFERVVTIYAGGGFMYNIVDPFAVDTIDGGTYPDVRVRRYDVPVFIGVKAMFCKGNVRPVVLAQGGIYAFSLTPNAEVGVGMAVATGRNTAFNLIVSARNTVWPCFTPGKYEGIPFRVAPSVKIGFSF